MKSLNMTSIPTDVLKTSMPQTWHLPRGEKLAASTSDDVVLVGYDPQSPYRQPKGLRSTLYNPLRTNPLPITDLKASVQEVDSSCLLLSVLTINKDTPMESTKFGQYPKGSPISYQQKMSSHYILNILDAEFPALPVENVMSNQLSLVLDEMKTTKLNSLYVTAEECVQIEEMTRLQSSDPCWHAVRKDRLTASIAGDIVKRRAGML